MPAATSWKRCSLRRESNSRVARSSVRRVALLGFGSIAEHGHLPALRSFPTFEVIAIADVSPSRRDAAAALLPAATLYRSPGELIERAEVDVVDICTPPSTHADLIAAACRRGIPDIVCEKPLVLSSAEYERIARAREESSARVISVNNWRHSDLFRLVGNVIRRGDIGAVVSVRLRTERSAAARGHTGWEPSWRTDRAHSGGGIILDHGWHQLYLLLGWIEQPITTIRAVTRTAEPRNAPVEDEAILDLTFPSGRGKIELFWTASGRSNDGEIEGTQGKIAVYDDRMVVHNSAGTSESSFSGRVTESSYHPEWFREVFRHTILAVDRNEADRNFAEAGLLVRTIEAAYRSAREGGKEVTVERATVPGAGMEKENVSGRGASASA